MHLKRGILDQTVGADEELTGLWNPAAASAPPLPLSSDCQMMTGVWMSLYPPGSHWSGRSLRPKCRGCCLPISHRIWGSLSLSHLQTVRHWGLGQINGTYECLWCKHCSVCLPGSIGVSPSSISLRVKSVGMYLGFCQNQKLFLFTTTDRTDMVSFRLDTGIRRPPWSTSSTKFLVAVANISQLGSGWEGAQAERSRGRWRWGGRYSDQRLRSTLRFL